MLTLPDMLDRGAEKRAPGPRGHPIFGSLPRARRDPLRLFLQSFREFGDVVRYRFGPKVAHLVSSPEGVNHILAENNKNYGKQTRGYDNLRYVLGNGLLTSEGETWKRQRRIAQPGFHKQRIAAFAQTMVRAADAAAVSLEARRGQVVDLHHEMMRLTLRIVGETLLGYDPTDAADEVGSALTFLLRIANERSATVLNLPPVLPTRENLKFKRSLATLDAVVLRMIGERRRNPGDRGDLLSMLMAARDEETGEAMDDRQLRDEVMTIFLAGHETTANALTFSFVLLARYPAAFRELRAELDGVLAGRPVSMEALARLTLTRRTLLESMRLYPPAWMIARSVSAADEIGGYVIPARSLVFISPYVVHRHPKHWDDPEGFDPQRFAREPERGSYLPFGGGPRMCIGNGFATMEAEIVLATLASRLRFELAPGYPFELEPSITLRPRSGVWMTVR